MREKQLLTVNILTMSGRGQRWEAGDFDVFSIEAKLARGPTEVADLPLAPVDPSPSWADTLPEIACVSNPTPGKCLLVSCSG